MAVQNRVPSREVYRLVGRHTRLIGSRSDDDLRALSDHFVLTFRPSNRTNSFQDRPIRPAGHSTAVALLYDEPERGMTLTGLRARAFPGGFVSYGDEGRREFQFNGRFRPGRIGPPNRLSVDRHPLLIDLMLRMDKLGQRRRHASLPTIPELPRILLGFAPDSPPSFEACDGLKRLAARRAGISRKKLDANAPELVERLLRQTWEEALDAGTQIDPSSGMLLVDAELCSVRQRPLRVFEDFRGLVGDWLFNPARELEIVRLPNPANRILACHGINPRGGFEEEVPQTVVDQMAAEFRAALGDAEKQFDEEDLLDALIHPDLPATACSRVMPRMRRSLPCFWSETVTDLDLRRAVSRPDDPLFAAGACRVQVLRRRNVESPWLFTPDDLGRRAEFDCRPIVWGAQVRTPDRPVPLSA